MLYLFVRLFSSLPLAVLQVFGGFVGLIIYLVSSSYRLRLKTNLDIAASKYNFKPNYVKSAICSGVMFGDSLWIWRNEDLVFSKIQIENEEELIELATNGNGLIILASHFGGFECIPHIFTQKIKTTAMYRPAKKLWVNELMTRTREGSRINFVPASLKGVRIFKRALANGEVVALVADQVPSIKDGLWAKMFDQDVFTISFPFKLAQGGQASTLFVSAERLGLGKGWKFRFRLAEKNDSQTALEAINAMNLAFEQMILDNPCQYLWSYNRYKNPIGQKQILETSN